LTRKNPQNFLKPHVDENHLMVSMRSLYRGTGVRTREELEAYLRCGIHHYGFLRVRCPKGDCALEHALPFSCKKRGFCSSCFAKRAAEIEEHLTENLLPRVPYRQYVLTFPHSLRYRLAWDSDLLAVIHKAVIDCIYRFIRDKFVYKIQT